MTTLTDYKLINVGYFRHADQDADGQCSIGINYYRCCLHARFLCSCNSTLAGPTMEWNSTLYMLQRCLLLKNAINHVLAESKYANLVPTGEQWLAAEKLCALLKPFQIATDFLQGEIYPTLGSVSRIITTLVQGLQGAMPPVHWQLRARWSDLPIIVQQVRSFILKDMRARWNPSDLLLCMGAITHPGHKSLSWLNPADKNRIEQLKTEMINVLGVNPATAEEDGSEEAGPPAKKPACSAEEEDFNLLFGQKEDEGLEPVEADDLLKVIQDELERYLKTAETNFRSDDPLLWWRNHESCFPTIAKLARNPFLLLLHQQKEYFLQRKIFFKRSGGASYRKGYVDASF